MAKAKAPKSRKPKGLFVFGTDGGIYSVKDKAALVEVKGDEGVHGFGIKEAAVSRSVPAPQQEADVKGQDLDIYGFWHMYWKWGYIYNEIGRLIYVHHYHPYGTAFAIYEY